eukprot:GHVL01034821.1.p1 GENE.GHVL01034821.1~~GHVL01034821.1.p1  ORF type:complete len:119 (-),score=10.39 GHVL01034821.1:88-444(-)
METSPIISILVIWDLSVGDPKALRIRVNSKSVKVSKILDRILEVKNVKNLKRFMTRMFLVHMDSGRLEYLSHNHIIQDCLKTNNTVVLLVRLSTNLSQRYLTAVESSKKLPNADNFVL